MGSTQSTLGYIMIQYTFHDLHSKPYISGAILYTVNLIVLHCILNFLDKIISLADLQVPVNESDVVIMAATCPRLLLNANPMP